MDPRSSTTDTYQVEQGFSLLELIVAIAISTFLLGTAALHYRDLLNPSQSGAAALGAFFKEARARAVSTTSAYRVQPANPTQVIVYSGSNCSSTPTQDTRLILDLPQYVSLTDISWSTCFQPRGLATDNITATLIDDKGDTHSVEVFLGGAVRID